MKKRLLAFVISITLIMGLCSCSIKASYVIDKNGNIKLTNVLDIEEDNMKKAAVQMGEKLSDLTEGLKVITVDGVKYYRSETTEEMKASDFLYQEGYAIGSDRFVIPVDGAEKSLDDIKKFYTESGVDLEQYGDSYTYKCSVTFSNEITKTSGKLSKDKKTVTWNVLKEKGTLYAFTDSYKDTKKPSISGVKENGVYTNSVKVKFKDNSVIASAKLDGKNFKSGKKVSVKGTHTLTVEDVFGNTNTVKFIVK